MEATHAYVYDTGMIFCKLINFAVFYEQRLFLTYIESNKIDATNTSVLELNE